MARIYAPADVAALRRLAAGEPVELTAFVAASQDEEDEYDALLVAAEDGPVVVTAELADADAPIRLEDVEALHLDADGSGDLGWYAPQELEAVIALLEG